MAPHTDEQSSFLTSSGRHDPRPAPVGTSSRFLSRAYTFIPAVVLGLHALPATAAGLDATKVAADPTMQRTLEAIDGAHHLSSVGPLAQYVIALDKQRGQTCTLADKQNDIFLLDCAASDKSPAHTLLLNGENGRLLVVAMYDKVNRPLDSATAFVQLTNISPTEPETVAKLGSVVPTKATSDPDAFLPGLPHSVDLANGTDATTRFWASGYDSRRSDLGSASDLDTAIARKGGRCVIGPALGGSGSATGADGSASQIVCRFPKAANPSPDAADELVLEASFSQRDCLRGGRNCYEIRDITLNDERLTHAQYLQLVSGRAQQDPNASKFDPFAPAPGAPLKTYVAKDACLFTSTQVAGHPMKVDMGSLYPLDAAFRKAGGRCYFDETNAGHMTLTCHYPETRRQTMHELALEGNNDNAGCYGVDSIKLDDKPLSYARYNQIFVQHR